MRAVVGEAIATGSASRFPRLLLGGRPPSLPEHLEHRLDQLATRVDEIVAELHHDDVSYRCWLFVPAPTGYTIVEHRGSELDRRRPLVLDGRPFRVSLIGHSPFLDSLPCAYLEAA